MNGDLKDVLIKIILGAPYIIGFLLLAVVLYQSNQQLTEQLQQLTQQLIECSRGLVR